jgi:hypothetical protein
LPLDQIANATFYNKKAYDSWSDALSWARKIVNENKDDMATLWYRTTIIHEGDGCFSLRCATCHKAFSMKDSRDSVSHLFSESFPEDAECCCGLGSAAPTG